MKRAYSPPKLAKVGTLTGVTRTLKDLGLFDNTYFKNQDSPLVNIS